MYETEYDEYENNEVFRGDEDHGGEDHGGEDDDDVRGSYDTNDFISKPVKSETCTIDENVLRHQYPLAWRGIVNFD